MNFCWILNGKPADWKPDRQRNDWEKRSNAAAEIIWQISAPCQASQSTALIHTTMIAHQGNPFTAITAKLWSQTHG